MKTFVDLKDEVLRYFDLASEPDDSADVVMVENTLNSANQTRATEDNWKFMLSGEKTLAVVAGQQEYILPMSNFSRFYYLWSTTNNRFASSMAMREVPYNGVGFDQQTDGDNLYYEIIDSGSVVQAQPASALALTITSTDSEAAGPQLYIEGEDGDGNEVSDTIGVGDTTGNSYSKVSYYSKLNDFVGTLSLKTSNNDVLLTLSPSEYAKSYSVLKFHNIPATNETFKYKYFRKPRVMQRDFDTPDLPFPHSNVLVYDALLSLATYNELDSESVNIWRDKQQECLAGLYLYKLNSNTVAGIGTYISETSMLN